MPVWQIIFVRMSTTWLGCYLCEFLLPRACRAQADSAAVAQTCDGRMSSIL